MSAPRVGLEWLEEAELRRSADGRRLFLHDAQRGSATLLATVDEMFAITVVWNAPSPKFLVWLSTIDHRSLAFDGDDLKSRALMGWLEQLPGWAPPRLETASSQPGLHLVWRRSEP